ncbi:ribose-5-phosphate isomerase [Actinomyces polynesiensis]|uniref:ribose-5-phosphate isomerase n=1 Tax=Actinomyces polynesiensis TaxID=1325934 RepID=UPI0005BA72D5|nr:ribose-5-phosphate isomerase [Actinomyces polynesiensis]
MRVHIASDHAGFELKAHLVEHLREEGFEVVDHGAETYDPLDNYPPMCLDCAEAVAADPGSLGIVIGGSGNGEQIAANKARGIRAALAWSEETAALARQHNDANVVSIGARMHTAEEATRFVDVFLATPFSGDQRHQHRIDQLTNYEQSGLIDRD